MGSPGKIAYEAYRESSGGVSLINGDPLPEWNVLTTAVKKAWDAAAEAVRAFYSH